MPRQQRTPRERAELALGIAERRYNRAIEVRDRLASELVDAEAEVTEATQLRAYAKQHPALQTPSTTPTQEEGITA